MRGRVDAFLKKSLAKNLLEGFLLAQSLVL
jgi:hypothetical protein